MKRRIIYIWIGAAAAAALLAGSGCEHMVKSAVVAEYTDENSKEESEDLQDSTSRQSVRKTVAEQINPPDVYETTLTAELRSAERENKDKPMKFTVAAEAPVEIPQAEAIFLKNADRMAGTDEMAESMIQAICQGRTAEVQDGALSEDSGNGAFLAGDIPYRYAYTAGRSGQAFSCWFDSSQLPDTADDVEVWQSEIFEKNGTESGKVSSREAEQFVEELGLQDFRILSELHENMPRDGKKGPVARDAYTFERMVDGIPVNYVQEQILPVYEKAAFGMNEDGTLREAEDQAWMQENLKVEFAAGAVRNFQYGNGLEISDLSDEEQFLLPFEEIRDIFEKTIAVQMMGEENKYGPTPLDGAAYTRYPSMDADAVEMTITKVKLGYMRTRDNGSSQEGILIPVWDFYGVWTEEISSENGSTETATMDEEYVPMLTIDARDGSVIQRRMGY